MVKVIAEAGVNHNGSAELAFKLVDAAYAAGVDVVKFQTFKASSLVTENAKQAEYQSRNTGIEETQFNMLKRLELDYDTHHALIDYCAERSIEFLSTAFDSESLAFLVNDLGLKTLKISSGELTNLPFILEHAKTGCELIVSTGMATLGEIEEALSVIAFGFIADEKTIPSIDAFSEAYASEKGQKALREKVTVLHCTTEYPAPSTEINLRAMSTMAKAFGLNTGYSDHSEGITIPTAATAMGACIIEKHFTLDKAMEGPDHKASLDPNELIAMVQAIRVVEDALGSGIKVPQPSELKNKSIARKSLVASRAIVTGQIIHGQDLIIKRPGTGTIPSRYWQIVGSVATRDYSEGQLLEE